MNVPDRPDSIDMRHDSEQCTSGAVSPSSRKLLLFLPVFVCDSSCKLAVQLFAETAAATFTLNTVTPNFAFYYSRPPGAIFGGSIVCLCLRRP